MLDCLKVNPVSVSSKLNTVGKPIGQVLNEGKGRSAVAPTNHPARHQLCVRAEGCPSPNISITELAVKFPRHVLFFGIAEGPYLITLNASAMEIAKRVVLIGDARFSNIAQQFEDGSLCNSRQADSRPNRVALDEGSRYLRTLLGIESIHGVYYA